MDLKPIPKSVICIIVATILFCGLNLQQVGALDDEKSEYEKKRAKLEKMRAEKKAEYEKKLAEKIAEDTSVSQAEPLPSETIYEEKTQNEKRITLENARKQLKGTYEKLVSEGTKERGEYGLARID